MVMALFGFYFGFLPIYYMASYKYKCLECCFNMKHIIQGTRDLEEDTSVLVYKKKTVFNSKLLLLQNGGFVWFFPCSFHHENLSTANKIIAFYKIRC